MILGYIAALVVGIKVAEILCMYMHVRIYTACGLFGSIWNIKALESGIVLMQARAHTHAQTHTHTHTHTHSIQLHVCAVCIILSREDI